MLEIMAALVVFALLCSSAGLGIVVRPRLPESHQTRETIELMQLTIGLLATFAAIVLGLLTASVKRDYDNAALGRQQYALELNALDACLSHEGPDSASARDDIHSYTAAVIASTWPLEPPPVGVSYPDTSHMPRVGASPVLEKLMDKISLEVLQFAPANPQLSGVAALCRDRYKDVSHARLTVIEAARDHLFEPFYGVLVLWLMIIFACFGLVAPRTSLSAAVIVLCAISLSSVMFVIVDLSRPYGGFFSIPSTAMRSALNEMLSRGP